MTGIADGGFSLVDAKLLVESPYNPRLHFNQQSLQDLADSMKEKGVLTPLLVRSKDETSYEILDGARRARAAKLAGITELPVIIRTLTDQQALEVLVISNLQRENLHPIEEANGYKTLIDQLKFDPATIADRIGKSVVYVYQRLQLLKLIAAARKAFLDGEIQLGHAQLLMRLQPRDQETALDSLYDRDYGNRTKHIKPPSKLHEWIKDHCFLDLHSAPWKKDVAVADILACTTCPKRSGCSPSLFPDITNKDVCTDPTCFAKKMAESIKLKEKEIAADGGKTVRISTDWHSDNEMKKLKAIGKNDYHMVPRNKKKCPTTVKGIVVDGDGRGQVHDICTNTQCKTHRQSYSGGSSSAPVKRSPQAIAAEKKEKMKTVARDRAHEAACHLIAEKAMKEFSISDLGAIASEMVGNTSSDSAEQIAVHRGWLAKPEKKKNVMSPYGVAEKVLIQHVQDMEEKSVLALMLELTLLNDAPGGYHSGQVFLAAAKRYKLNWKDCLARAMEAEKAIVTEKTKQDIKAIESELEKRKKPETDHAAKVKILKAAAAPKPNKKAK